MKWWAISGSWKLSNNDVEAGVRKCVSDIIQSGDGIVSGGALRVDYYATDEALKHNPSGDRVKVIIPTPLPVFSAHFRKRGQEGVITPEQAELLIAQLDRVKELGSLFEMSFDVCNEDTYYARNTEVVKASSGLLAFQVNSSKGTQDTIDKAVASGMDVIVRHYTL